MLNKLRYKLTLICILITTSVLTITIALLFIFSRKELTARSQHALDNELYTLIHYLESTSTIHSFPTTGTDVTKQIIQPLHTISHSWLFQLETNNASVIYLEENHIPLLYSGIYQTATNRHQLIASALNEATEVYNFNYYSYSSSDSPILNTLSFDYNPTSFEHYLVATASIRLQNTNYQILILKDMQYDDAQILHQLIIYLLLSIIATIALTLFSFWFSGRAIKPVIESEKRQKDFVAAASHELRSPLTVLSTNSSALAEEYPDIKQCYFYQSISLECERMKRLINDLLLLSHADTAIHWSLEYQLLQPDTLLLEIYEAFESTVKAKSHQLHLSLPEDAVSPCQLDKNRLIQVFGILINNAIAYTPEGSTITLSLSSEPHKLCFIVQDNGPGIADEYKEEVFKRFYRIDPSRHQKDHSGLGLSIAYELITLHKGKLILEDTFPHGCTFKIILPQ